MRIVRLTVPELVRQNGTSLLAPDCVAAHRGQEEKCLIASVVASRSDLPARGGARKLGRVLGKSTIRIPILSGQMAI